MVEARRLKDEEVQLLTRYVQYIGGVATASRKLDIPMSTLRGALEGKEQREASVYLIRDKLKDARRVMNEAAS